MAGLCIRTKSLRSSVPPLLFLMYEVTSEHAYENYPRQQRHTRRRRPGDAAPVFH